MHHFFEDELEPPDEEEERAWDRLQELQQLAGRNPRDLPTQLAFHLGQQHSEIFRRFDVLWLVENARTAMAIVFRDGKNPTEDRVTVVSKLWEICKTALATAEQQPEEKSKEG